MKDALGDRMKSQYEDRTRTFLPRRTYTIIRVDGKAFHTFTKRCERPYDRDLMMLMDQTAKALCKEIQGVAFAYTQSDEISLLLTDFATENTCAWFDGNIQKMASVAASIATSAFNEELMLLAERQSGTKEKFDLNGKPAMFDARVFTIPDPIEVENYFIWRQADASRNSVQMAARAVYSHKELEGKNVSDLHELLHAKGINWNNFTTGAKRGRVVKKHQYIEVDRVEGLDPLGHPIRSKWIVLDGTHPESFCEFAEIPVFTQGRAFLRNLIPQMPKADFGLEG